MNPMTDLVERLIENNPERPVSDRFAAAQEIERLHAVIENETIVRPP